MQQANDFIVLNIREYLENDDGRLGEDKLLQFLSGFSCPLNKDVERFLKQQSVEFAKKHQAVTYLQHFHIGWCQCLHQHITVKAGQIQPQKGNEKDCAQSRSRFSFTASPGIG